MINNLLSTIFTSYSIVVTFPIDLLSYKKETESIVLRKLNYFLSFFQHITIRLYYEDISKGICGLSNFNEQFIYAIIIIIIGYTLKRLKIIKEQDGESLARVIFNVTLPALIIVSFSDIAIESSLFLMIVIGFLYGTMIAFLSLFIFRKEARKTKGMIAMLVAGFNIGLFAYPLVGGIWGKKGIQYFGMFDVGNALVIFGVVYLIGSYFSSDDSELHVTYIAKKLTKSIPLVTYIIVCLIAIIGIQLPTFIIDVSEIISAANMPLSFFTLGIYLSFTMEKDFYKRIAKILSLRYGLGLAVGFALFFTLPFDEMFRYTVLLGLILPIPLSVLPYAVEFDYDRKFVGTTANITIMLSFFLLWAIANLMIT